MVRIIGIDVPGFGIPTHAEAKDVLAGAMKSEKLISSRFTIEGHADPRGSDDFNLKLSLARAESVRGYLVESHGVAAERVNAVGKGSSALMNPSVPAAPVSSGRSPQATSTVQSEPPFEMTRAM